MSPLSGSNSITTRDHPGRRERAPRLARGLFVPGGVTRTQHNPNILLRFLAPLGMTAFTFFSSVGLLYAQEQSATAISHEVKEIFERCSKAVVKIHGVDEHSEICGTGFFIDPTGTLYTAYTVGGEAGNFTIEFGGKKYPARQLLADIRSGTAMLKIDETTPALPIGKSEELDVATPVVAVGYPLDLPETPNFGMVAGFDHKYLGRYFSTTHLRVNLPTQRGDILLQVGRKKVAQPEDVLDASFFITAGDDVPITVMRGNEKLTFHVQAELHPASKNVPMLSDGTRVPAAADANRAMPLKLESAAQMTP